MVTGTPPFFLPNEKCAFRYLVELLHPRGPVCPECGGRSIRIRTARRKLICSRCLKEWSPLRGTLYQGSHLPLHTWLAITWDLLHLKGPITAARIADRWDIGSYRTAWYLMARIRTTMGAENREKMGGVMEMDDHIVRGLSGDYGKTAIFGALQFGYRERRKVKRIPRLRLKLKQIVNPDEMRLKNFLDNQIKRNSRIYTDDRKLYLRSWLGLNNFTVLSSQERGHPFRIRGILQDVEEHLRVDHGGIQDKYLQNYLDEAVFYFHHLEDRDRGFEALVKACLASPPVSREALIHPPEHLTFLQTLWAGWGRAR